MASVAAVSGADVHQAKCSNQKIGPVGFEGMRMSHVVSNHKILASRAWALRKALALCILLASCNKPGKPTAEKAIQKTFASPLEAGAAFFEAARSGDHSTLTAIFGPDSKDVLFTGDSLNDKKALQDFIAAYAQMNRWGKIKAGGEVLYIGADNYPFPIPLGQNPSGRWYFDTAAGKDEILARRIGKGELTAIAACEATADAQRQYFDHAHDGDKVKQYAQQFVSDQGKQNGLYWPVQEDQAPSPLGQLGDFSKALGSNSVGDQPQRFKDYYYRMLTKQGDKAKGGAKDYIVNGKLTGGFAILAYPAEYRNTGIMTFLVGQDGIVYQKDLGEKTADAAHAMSEYNPGDGWNPAIQPSVARSGG